MAGGGRDTVQGHSVSRWRLKTVATHVQPLLPSTPRGRKAAGSERPVLLRAVASCWQAQHHKAPNKHPQDNPDSCRQRLGLTLAAQFLQEAGAVGAVHDLALCSPLLLLLLLLQGSSLSSGVLNPAEGFWRKVQNPVRVAARPLADGLLQACASLLRCAVGAQTCP